MSKIAPCWRCGISEDLDARHIFIDMQVILDGSKVILPIVVP